MKVVFKYKYLLFGMQHIFFFQDFEQKLKEYNSIQVESEAEIANYYNIRQELEALGKQFRSFITKPQFLIPFLQPGRLIKVLICFL